MVKMMRTAVAWLLVLSVGTPAVAGEVAERARGEAAVGLRESIGRVTEQAAQSENQRIPRGYLWAGTALFVGGMTAGLYGFLNNKNGKFPEFGEAEATDKHLGAAGLAAAFAGGTILFLGSRRASRAPNVTFAPGRITASKTVSW
jgi:hypothetical protein